MSARLTLTCAIVFIAAASAEGPAPSGPPWKRLLQGEDAKKAAILNQKAVIAEFRNDYPAAIQAGKELLELRERLQGQDHWEVQTQRYVESMRARIGALNPDERKAWKATAISVVEADRLDRLSQFRASLPLRQAIVEQCRKVLGEDHPITATARNNVANNLDGQGRFDEAAKEYEASLDIRRKALGEAHPDTANSYSNLANNLRFRGRHGEATLFFRSALTLRRQILGDLHPVVASSLNGLATNLISMGRNTEAHSLTLEALEICRATLGEDQELTADCYNNLAVCLENQQRPTEAIAILEKALKIYQNRRGYENEQVATILGNIAGNLKDLGKVAGAEKLYRQSLEMRRRVHGERHPDVALSLSNLATCLFTQNRLQEANEYLEQSLQVVQQTLGERHPLTVTFLINAARAMDESKLHEKAAQYHQRALALCRELLGASHPNTLDALNGFGQNLLEQKKLSEAEAVFRAVLETRRNTQGNQHPATSQAANNLAIALEASGRATEEIPLLEEALTINRLARGESHSETVNAYLNLSATQIRRGQRAAAIQTLRDSVYPFDVSRSTATTGIDRATYNRFDPRKVLAVLLAPTDPRQAWDLLERSLGRGYLDQQAIGKQLQSQEQKRRSALEEECSRLQPEIAALATKLKPSPDDEKLLKQKYEQRKVIDDQLAKLAVSASSKLVATQQEIQRRIPADSAMVIWVDVFTRSQTVSEHWACVLRSEGEPQWTRLPGRGKNGAWTEEDLSLADRFRESITRSPKSATLAELTRQLQAQRIEPIRAQFSGVKNVRIVAIDEMAGLPVEVLLPELTVSYVPSGTFIARQAIPSPLPPTLLAVGDPIYELSTTSKGTPRPDHGIMIQSVQPASNAAKVDVAEGDVMLKYNGMKLDSMDDLKSATSKVAADTKAVSVTVWRIDTSGRGQEMQFTVPAGPLGIAVTKEPAAEAIAKRESLISLLNGARGKWVDLPGTRFEVDRIGSMFDKPELRTDSQANELTLESMRKAGSLKKFRYLHFATHGVGDSKRAFESHLVLSQDHPVGTTQADGPLIDQRLTSREVLDYWKLDADLVTLSACESAVGKFAGGDGLLGFAQAFLLAGSRSVCLSLWKVDDTATTLLMTRFYQNLLGKRPGIVAMTKAAALHEAKAWLRDLSRVEADELVKQIASSAPRDRGPVKARIEPAATPAKSGPLEKPFADPRFWAAFVLIGAAE